MAKRRFETKRDIAENVRRFWDEFDDEDDNPFFPALFSEEEEEVERYEEEERESREIEESSGFGYWEELARQSRDFVLYLEDNLERYLDEANKDLLSYLHEQVVSHLRNDTYFLDDFYWSKLVRIEYILRKATHNAEFVEEMVCAYSDEFDVAMNTGFGPYDAYPEPPIRRKLTKKSYTSPDTEEDPRDDRTSWKRGLIRTRRGIMRTKDARDLDKAEHQHEWLNQWTCFDYLPRIRVRKPWMIRSQKDQTLVFRMTWQDMDVLLADADRQHDRESLEIKASWLGASCNRIMPGMTLEEAIDYALEQKHDLGSPLWRKMRQEKRD